MKVETKQYTQFHAKMYSI